MVGSPVVPFAVYTGGRTTLLILPLTLSGNVVTTAEGAGKRGVTVVRCVKKFLTAVILRYLIGLSFGLYFYAETANRFKVKDRPSGGGFRIQVDGYQRPYFTPTLHPMDMYGGGDFFPDFFEDFLLSKRLADAANNKDDITVLGYLVGGVHDVLLFHHSSDETKVIQGVQVEADSIGGVDSPAI